MLDALKDYLNRYQTEGGNLPEQFLLISQLLNNNIGIGQDYIKFRGQSREGLVQISVNTMMMPRKVNIDISSIIKTENLTPETLETLEVLCRIMENAFIEAYNDAQNKIINMFDNQTPNTKETKMG